MSGGDFFDTNVLVYQFDDRTPGKQETAHRVIRTAISEGSGVISFQVVQECLNVVTRKLIPPLSAGEALQFLQVSLLSLWHVWPSRELYEHTLGIQARHSYSFYDSLIIAAALEAGCARLYSEDFQDGQRIEGLTIVDPFRT